MGMCPPSCPSGQICRYDMEADMHYCGDPPYYDDVLSENGTFPNQLLPAMNSTDAESADSNENISHFIIILLIFHPFRHPVTKGLID